MKSLVFLGTSLDDVREFPRGARREAGFQLDKIQHEEDPDDWKPMPGVGPGVREIRIRDEAGAFRVMYVAKFLEVIYVLHAFQKKTRATAQRDIEVAQVRYADLTRKRKRP